MKLFLKTLSEDTTFQSISIDLVPRLPNHIQSASDFVCNARVVPEEDYYLLTLSVRGKLNVLCQRCLRVFHHEYINQTELALCQTDSDAERLMERFECVSAQDNQVDLSEILADDLHLFAPEKHETQAVCDAEILQFIQSDY